MSKEINGYKLFKSDDGAICISKSKEDLFEFYKDLLMGAREYSQLNCNETAFNDGWQEIELDSDYANEEFNYLDEDSYFNETGEDKFITTTLYKDYVDWAEKDEGTQILFDF